MCYWTPVGVAFVELTNSIIGTVVLLSRVPCRPPWGFSARLRQALRHWRRLSRSEWLRRQTLRPSQTFNYTKKIFRCP